MVNKSTRRRYDTEALIATMKSDRRNRLFLAGGVALIVVALIGFYLSGIAGSDIPQVPDPKQTELLAKDGARAQKDEKQGLDAKSDKSELPPKDEDEKKAEDSKGKAAGTASVSITLTRKAGLWVDGKKIGRVKRKNIKLDVGKHVIKARLGKKTVVQTIVVKGGENFALKFDARRKKATLSKR